MGSRLTDALVHLGADVHAFVRATSSGALNNIGHLRDKLRVQFADLTDRPRSTISSGIWSKRPIGRTSSTSARKQASRRAYETVMANTVGTLNLLQSIVEQRARGREVRHRRHVRECATRARPSPTAMTGMTPAA